MLKNRKYILLIFSSLMMLFLFNFETISTSITRSIHKENLKKSRSSKTYGISRTERKNLQLPPNQYNEQIRMLSMDPIKGMVLTEELYKLQEGNMKFISQAISCDQEIASNGAFTMGMLAEFTKQIEMFGASRYKELYWECGAIGQQLYLEATSLNLSATGIGCFLDDILHGTIGLKTNQFQSLYHFTIGRGLVDTRLSTKKPYQNRI